MEEIPILILAETCFDLKERFAPLVEEVKVKFGSVPIIGIFLGMKPCTDPIKDGGLFSETYFYDQPDSAILLIQSTPHRLLITFINHNTTHRDTSLYLTAQSASSRCAFVVRNRINLNNYLTTQVDDSDHIRHEIAIAPEIHSAINRKALLLSLLVASVVILGKIRYLLRGKRRERFKRILFIKLDVLGDMIVALPSIAALRCKFPEAELTVLASSRGAGILHEQNELYPGGLCDRIQVWDAPWHNTFVKVLGVKVILQMFRQLPQFWYNPYDIVIQPVNFGTGVAFALLTMGRRVLAVVDERLPLAVRLRSLVSDPVGVPQDRIFHMKDCAELLLSRLGVDKVVYVPGLIVANQARQIVVKFLEGEGYRGGRLILINVGAGHRLRVWGNHKFAQLVRELDLKYSAMIVLIGSPIEQEMAAEIKKMSCIDVVNVVGQFSMNELIALVSLANLIITVDTGIMHLAAALNTPMVAIFGAGLVDFCKPLSQNYIIVKEELGCSGCGDNCFVSGHPPCLERVTVSQVLQAVEFIVK
jgi:ADP-heptose:LPS heptosyltransferase